MCDLNAGTLFGELAILYNCRRTATITSKTDIEVRVTTIKLKNASKGLQFGPPWNQGQKYSGHPNRSVESRARLLPDGRQVGRAGKGPGALQPRQERQGPQG